MIKNKKKMLIWLGLIPLFFCGCWNYEDLNKRALELSFGVDEVNDKLEFSGEIAKLVRGKGKAEITDVYQYSSLGNFFEGSRVSFDSRVTAPDFSGAVRSVVFNQKYAEVKGIEAYINRLYYVPDFRNSVLVAICKEPVKELYEGKIKNDISIGYAIEDTITTLANNGVALAKTVQQVKADIEFKDSGYLLPYINKNNSTIEYIGLAVMKDSKLVGTVDYKNCNGFIFLLSSKAKTQMAITHPRNDKILIATNSSLQKRKIKTSYENNKINVNIDLKVKSEILYLYEFKAINKEDTEKLEKMISDNIKNDVMYALNLSKNEFKCDVFRYAKYFKADNPDVYKKLNWQQEYPDINFNVNVKTTITGTNLLDLRGER